MDRAPFGLLELGSNSLKLHIVRPAADGSFAVHTEKRTWRAAHEFFAAGHLGESAIAGLIRDIRSMEAVSGGIPVSSMIAVATGIFRELEELPDIVARVKAETGVRIRVIDGGDEARLMARSFPVKNPAGSAILCDVGGATTQWAWFRDGQPAGFGSLPLGAIRNDYRFREWKDDPAEYRRRSAARCDEVLKPLPFPRGTSILVTGGTARSAAACAGTSRISRESLEALVEGVVRDGPPAGLSPERAEIFLSGLVILDRMMARFRSKLLEVYASTVGEGMAIGLIRLLSSRRRSDIRATLILPTDPRDKAP